MGSVATSAPQRAPDDSWDEAFKESLVTALPDQVTWLMDALGPRITTAALGLADARTVRRWRDERTEPREHDVRGRVAVLFRLAKAIAGVYSNSVAATFLRSANPQLDDMAPLVLLADNDPDLVQKDLLAAARAFLEG